jgi:hypothetical protein
MKKNNTYNTVLGRDEICDGGDVNYGDVLMHTFNQKAITFVYLHRRILILLISRSLNESGLSAALNRTELFRDDGNFILRINSRFGALSGAVIYRLHHPEQTSYIYIYRLTAHISLFYLVSWCSRTLLKRNFLF